MAADEAMLEAVGSGLALPTLRLYAWQPACLSLGFSQSAADADLVRLAARGWQMVRRPTGGKAILHTDELTYAVALPPTHPLAALGIVESYRHISRALMHALNLLGASPHSDRRAPDAPARPAGPVCFEVPSHYEITVDGKKLIGSAQVRRKSGLLQHGTLPLTGDLTRICDALAYPDDPAREAARDAVRQRAITLQEALGRDVSWDEAAEAVRAGFEAVFDITLVPDTLSPAEIARAEALADEKHRSPDYLQAR
jgi:lipoate-protein ligase A